MGDTQRDLGRWRQTIRDWLAAGYKPTNIAGLLDAYRSGRLKHRRARHKSPEDYTTGEFAKFVEH